MELKTVYLRADKSISADIASGHFATNHSHINYYVDLTNMKTSMHAARKAADILAARYHGAMVDTILCLEGTNMLGAFMALELSRSSMVGMNSRADICVLTPELNSNNQMIFRGSTQRMVDGKHVVLLMASVSTGMTLHRALDCLNYYGGRLAGICAGFSAIREYNGLPVHSIFTDEDFPGYRTYAPDRCGLCESSPKLDAIVSNFGYSAL